MGLKQLDLTLKGLKWPHSSHDTLSLCFLFLILILIAIVSQPGKLSSFEPLLVLVS